MNALYVLIGVTFILVGLYVINIQIKKFKQGKQDQLGFDVRLLISGISALLVGIIMVVQYI
jgi:hypothetical protein